MKGLSLSTTFSIESTLFLNKKENKSHFFICVYAVGSFWSVFSLSLDFKSLELFCKPGKKLGCCGVKSVITLTTKQSVLWQLPVSPEYFVYCLFLKQVISFHQPNINMTPPHWVRGKYLTCWNSPAPVTCVLMTEILTEEKKGGIPWMFGAIKHTPEHPDSYYYQLTKPWQSTERTCDLNL